MSPEACPDRRGALGAAAIGRLDEAELVALRAHLDGCAACRQELGELESVAHLVSAVDVDHVPGADDPVLGAAPQGLSDLVVARVRDARDERDELRGRRARRRIGTIAAAVAGLAAAIAMVVAVALGSGPSEKAAARRTLQLHGKAATATATIIDDGDGTAVEFRGRVEDVGGDPYWLWLTDSSGRRLAAATFRDGSDGSFSIRGHGALPFSSVKRVWVTDEHRNVVLDTQVTPTKQ